MSTGENYALTAGEVTAPAIDPWNNVVQEDINPFIQFHGLEAGPVLTHLEQAFALIEEIKPKRAVPTHLSEIIDYEETSKKLPQNVELAIDGMSFETFAKRPMRNQYSRQFLSNNI